MIWSLSAQGQTLLGITVNIGERQDTRHSEAFKRALAPSGSLSVSKATDLGKEHWSIRYGFTCGVVPYNLKVVSVDTVTLQNDIFPFPDYSTIFASIDFMLAPKFIVCGRIFSIGAGVGVTGYASLVPNSYYGVHVANPDNSLTTVFEASMYAPANRWSSFWKIAALYDLTRSISLGIEYVNHARPAAEGSYEFYETQTPIHGTIEVYQREFRIGAFYRIKKRP